MTSVQVVETSVTNNSSFQNYPHPIPINFFVIKKNNNNNNNKTHLQIKAFKACI